MKRKAAAALASCALTALAACVPAGAGRDIAREAREWRTPKAVPTPDFPVAPLFPTWTEEDDGYRLYPGDVVEFQSVGAPELTRKLTVAPDGRLHPPLVTPIMAADRTPAELSAELSAVYATQLRNPAINIAPETFASQRVFVGGEVAKPGIYDLPGEIDPLQAIVLAGGFLPSARREEVAVLRRGAGGHPFMRVFDMKSVWAIENGFSRMPRLRRFDVIWVPRSRISEAGLFTQQFVRDALPITIGFNYQIGGQRF
jgi:polysaccharide export outer membrane protein